MKRSTFFSHKLFDRRMALGCTLSTLIALVCATLSSARPDSDCAALLALPEDETAIPLPSGCLLTSATPVDEMIQYLEKERKERGLIFKTWIKCDSSDPAKTPVLKFDANPKWLPSYKPLSYQFRRIVVILPFAKPIPQGSAVIAEVALMPKHRYASQIAGQCDGKFAVWK